jgi:pyruvate dehydrogenase E2 component (dihydrolipoamide acetyltransferase)
VSAHVIMPALGMAQETGRILRWLKSEGEAVRKGEPLLEVETDKVTVEIESPADGTLAAIRATEGEEVPVGEDVAIVLGAGESLADLRTEPALAAARRSAAAIPEPVRRATEAPKPDASPRARRLAREHGVVLASVAGSGPHGAVLASDVEAVVAAPARSAAGAADTSRIWTRMAERVTESWQTAPHFFLTREVDAIELERRRALAREGGATSVTATDLLLKICAGALREHPQVNARWHDGAAVQEDDVNIGIAVAVEDGLVVPVVRDVDRLELEAVAGRRAELVTAAREGRLRPDDVEGGTFTISNLGMYGVDGFFAIVNPPQVAILAVGRIAERVVAVGGVPAVRPTLALGLSFDHRAVDGARGAQFLDSLARLIGNPAGVLP